MRTKNQFENRSKTDVHYNHNHDTPELAHLEKWNDLAQKFFRMHQRDLRPPFFKRWGGINGRFRREIEKLETNYKRKCSGKNLVSRRSSFSMSQVNADLNDEIENSSEENSSR